MSTSATNPLAALYNNASSSTLPSQTTGNLDSEFLTMLMTELQNQDPTNPMDSTTMLAQQAQFESLSQMQNLNTNLTSLIAMQSVSQATTLIGQTITGTANGAAVTGVVSGITFNNGTPVLQVNTGGTGTSNTVAVQLSDVTSVL